MISIKDSDDGDMKQLKLMNKIIYGVDRHKIVNIYSEKEYIGIKRNYLELLIPRESHLRLSQRKLHKDCLDDGKQLELINKIIDIVSIEPE